MTELKRNVLCHDCGVAPGNPHLDGCDVARCLDSGGQRLLCDILGYTADHDCGQDVWTGFWPGELECIEAGWYVRWEKLPHEQYGRWVPTTVDDPEARPDLNRLATEALWDKENQRWVTLSGK